MTHSCRMGWAPLASLIADELPDAPRAKPPSLVRRQATEFKDGIGPVDLTDLKHPAARAHFGNLGPLPGGAGHQKYAIGGVAREEVAKAVTASQRELLASEWRCATLAQGVAARSAQEFTEAVEKLVASYPKPTEPEWIEWAGGECPVADGVQVEIRLRNGQSTQGTGCGYGWHRNIFGWFSEYDIVAYRILSEPAAPKADADGWVEWAGGASSPVPGECDVDIKVRTGKVVRCVRAGEILAAYWHHDNCNLDIVAYRVVPQ